MSLGVVAYTYNPSTREAKAEARVSQVQGYPGLQRKTQSQKEKKRTKKKSNEGGLWSIRMVWRN
jgi:hypothetical protein